MLPVMNIPTQDELIGLIERFRARHDDMPRTRFGMEATGDPNLLNELQRGRSPSLNVLHRLRDYMIEKDRAAGHGVTDIAPPAALSAGKDGADSPVVSHA